MLISLIHVPRTTATYTEQNWDQRSALGPGSDMGRSVERVGHRVCIIFPLLGSEHKPQPAVAMGTSPLFFYYSKVPFSSYKIVASTRPVWRMPLLFHATKFCYYYK